MNPVRSCRICASPLTRTFVDLGAAPPCEAIRSADGAEKGETAYPLHVRICERCLLVQLPEVVPAEEIFTAEYAYFSSFSTSWIEHARRYTVAMVERFGLSEDSFVVEVASNDGYLLQHFRDAGIPCLGIEPTANTAAAAVERGIPTEVVFLGEQTGSDIAARHGRADLVAANNVYAHVPDLAWVDEVAPSTSPAWFLRRFRCALVPICVQEADALLEQARDSSSPQDRSRLFLAAAGRMDQAQVFIPIAAPIRWSLVSGRVPGFAENPFAMHPLFALSRAPM